MQFRRDNHRHNVSVFCFCLTVHLPLCFISFIPSCIIFSFVHSFLHLELIYSQTPFNLRAQVPSPPLPEIQIQRHDLDDKGEDNYAADVDEILNAEAEGPGETL